jgi:bifunctional DNA-binding transcriptional regulator/antitoxin component of YhaV-PrlF toxin-antitoxin module
LSSKFPPEARLRYPPPLRKALSLKPGDPLLVRLEEGRLVLEPVYLLPVEAYTEERIREFLQASQADDEEVAAFRRAWGLE